MSWREILGALHLESDCHAQYSHNPHKCSSMGNCEDIGDIGDRKRESDSALQAYVELVRAIGASSHQILLHREEIVAELDEADIQALLIIDSAERRKRAELLAHQLCIKRLWCSDSQFIN